MAESPTALTTTLFGMEPSYPLQLLPQINSSINGTTPRFDGIEGQFGVTPEEIRNGDRSA